MPINTENMNGAQSLVRTLIGGGVSICFANPGTSEMHFVSALDGCSGMKCLLGLAEGVVTGAADGYYRMTDRPAATLLHLGPGLANGLSNLHNARKARSGIVNIVGDHAVRHLAHDAPLTCDIRTAATPFSDWVGSADTPDSVAGVGAQALRVAHGTPGGIATLILPADAAWGSVSLPGRAGAAGTTDDIAPAGPARPDGNAVDTAAARLRAAAGAAGRSALLLGGRALREKALFHAGQIAARTGCRVYCETFNSRMQRGAGRVSVDPVPYPVRAALEELSGLQELILVGAKAPIAFFAYPDLPSSLLSPETAVTRLAGPEDDIEAALEALVQALDAGRETPATPSRRIGGGAPGGALTSASIAHVLAAELPENAIVVDESLTTGAAFHTALSSAAPHDMLKSVGGSIGFGIPAAIGASVADRSRKTVALVGDGSSMYTLAGLWTLAREQLDVVVVIFANRRYQILHGELRNIGIDHPGPGTNSMLSLENPALDFVALAKGHGIDGQRVTDTESFARAFGNAMRTQGPSLIEVLM